MDRSAAAQPRQFLVPLLGIMAVTLLVYATALPNGFVWDDPFFIARNESLRGAVGLKTMLTSNLGAGGGSVNSFFRPFQELTFWTDYFLFGLNAAGYHLTNILLHGFAAFLVFFLLKDLLDSRPAALVGGLLFAVHPINTEAVAYISGRADSLAFIGILLALVTARAYCRSGALRALTGFCIASIFALLSKEMAVMIPLYVLLVTPAMPVRRRMTVIAVTVLLVSLYGLARATVWQFPGPDTVTVQMATPVLRRLATFIKVVPQYCIMLVLPLGLHMERSVETVASIADRGMWTGVVIIGALTFAAWRYRRESPLLLRGWSWFLAALVPYSNLMPLNAFMAEHWLYVPSAGIVIAVASVYGRLYADAGRMRARRGLLVAGAAAVMVGYGILTFLQNRVWHDEERLFASILAYNPDSRRVRFNYGRYYEEHGDFNRALKEYGLLLKENPAYTDASINMANILLREGRFAEAAGILKEAERYNAESVLLLRFKARANVLAGDVRGAVRDLEAVLRLIPDDPEVLVNLGDAYFRLNDYETAERYMRRALERVPRSVTNLNNLGSLYATIGRHEEAAKLWRESLVCNPNQPEIRRYLESVE